ncbi:c-type cytochrome [Silvanigrella paludirubra]|uniref:Methylamine utilization protein MauG n=1 Tax=Silvanigrella paludirubra TaxID=2499159 RepID=A0A6N6VU72_9BACT|nr:cytochrome c peroxidase [Silvanigrella paludirubra]KAB8039201.1 c-type cytochrome [Silvanigrella paludirubra]
MSSKFIIIILSIFSFNNLASAMEDLTIEKLKKTYKRPTQNEIPYPKDNLYNKKREDLGKMLFFDPRLSYSNVTSCATCHNPSFSWQDSLPKGVGFNHQQLGRKTPTILNLAWSENLFWDGRAPSLEAQSLGPIQSAKEMNLSLDKMVSKINRIDGYKDAFQKAFPNEKSPINETNVAKSLATFERGIVSGIAPFDKWISGDESAISESAKKGFMVFNSKGNCDSCHSGWNFTDNSFHDIGHPDSDKGRINVIPIASMEHAFKTPTLRNIDRRAPYMHDGSLENLESVIDFYNKGGIAKRPSVDRNIKELKLTEQEKKDLISFMKTLTSDDSHLSFDIPTLPTN